MKEELTKLESIAQQAAENLKHLIGEAQEEIQEAMHAVAEETALQDKEAVFKLGFTISLNLDKNKMSNDLAWSVRRKLTIDGEIPNPNQPELPMGDASVTISDGVQSVTIKGGDLKKIGKKKPMAGESQ